MCKRIHIMMVKLTGKLLEVIFASMLILNEETQKKTQQHQKNHLNHTHKLYTKSILYLLYWILLRFSCFGGL